MKILILQDMPLYTYRAYVCNNLVKRGYDVTVVSIENFENKLELKINFKSIKKRYLKIGPFRYIMNFNKIKVKNFDNVIIDPNVRILNYLKILMSLSCRKNLIVWGHMEGRTAKNILAQRVRLYLLTKVKALIFYDKITLEKFRNNGFDKKKLFLANNTQYVNNKDVNLDLKKEYFLFVGRLQKRKRIDLLIKSFKIFKNRTKSDIKLKIVGDGELLSSLKKIAINEGLCGDVVFMGKITNEEKLKVIFESAIAYISPGHVGLGVLHSFAFGIPVITCNTGIHAPEVSNCNDTNSFIVDLDEESIADKMCLLYNDSELLKQMSINAFNYYNKYCTLENMVDGIDNAIKYVNNNDNR